MIIIQMKRTTTEADLNQVMDVLTTYKAASRLVRLGDKHIIVAELNDAYRLQDVQRVASVEHVVHVSVPYPLVSRQWQANNSSVYINGVTIGGDDKPIVIAGPCSVETETQMQQSAKAVQFSGAHILRGGAYKPRTNPYSFQGLGVEGLQMLKEAGDNVGLPVITEVMSPDAVDVVSEYADILQIGTRNMANFDLLRAVGQSERPVLLKRGMAATVAEWLQAAEYIVSSGNPNVILCERGIRSFDSATRNTLDLAAAVLAKEKSHLPVIVDPSHATGVVSLIGPMARAAIAAGLDGVCVEMHPSPHEAWCDGEQALTPEQLNGIVSDVQTMGAFLTERTLKTPQIVMNSR